MEITKNQGKDERKKRDKINGKKRTSIERKIDNEKAERMKVN